MQPIENFRKDKKMSNGHINTCKRCINEKARKNYAKDPEKARAKAQAYKDNNREKIRAQDKIRYYNDLKKYRKSALDYRNRNKETCKDRERRWYEANKKEISKKANIKYHTNPQSKLRTLISRRILDVLKGVSRKSAGTIDLLGCSIEFFRVYLESKFLDGMSWENHGQYRHGGPMTWHIDHIVPCAAFDLTDLEQQKKCFYYTNLQPLWAIDNLSKGDSINYVK